MQKTNVHFDIDKETRIWKIAGIGGFRIIRTSVGGEIDYELATPIFRNSTDICKDPSVLALVKKMAPKNTDRVLIHLDKVVQAAGDWLLTIFAEELLNQVYLLDAQLERVNSLIALEEEKRKLVPLLRKPIQSH